MKLTMISDGSESGRISIRYDNESCGEVSIELKVTDDTFDVFGVCTGENNDFAGLLQNAAEKIKEEFNFERLMCMLIQMIRLQILHMKNLNHSHHQSCTELQNHLFLI